MLPSPALLIFPERVEQNLRRMLSLAPAERLRPHIKTHKTRELVEAQLALNITKFKVATIAEAELAALAGARDVLIAYQPVGISGTRVADLMHRFPAVHFSVVADDATAIKDLSRIVCGRTGPLHRDQPAKLDVLLDLDIGQHRTGIAPGPKAIELYQLIAGLEGLSPGGLHAYDGHVSQADPSERERACEDAFESVTELRKELGQLGLDVPRVVAGGTPTFGFHARRQDVECSPGTCVLWDAGYDSKLPDLGFVSAAVVLSRVVSKPGGNRLCLDLGHKALASEMPHPRVVFLTLPDARAVLHSEEHLVIETERSDEFRVGDCLYGVPWHICPTVALHSEAIVIKAGKVTGTWKIAARSRRLTI